MGLEWTWPASDPRHLGRFTTGTYGSYRPTQNLIRLSRALQTTSLEARSTILLHELTHLNDDLNKRFGNLADVQGDACYEAEARAFSNEANFWHMLFGDSGKHPADALESQENRKMWAFIGNMPFADLVVRTTTSYVNQCGL